MIIKNKKKIFVLNLENEIQKFSKSKIQKKESVFMNQKMI